MLPNQLLNTWGTLQLSHRSFFCIGQPSLQRLITDQNANKRLQVLSLKYNICSHDPILHQASRNITREVKKMKKSWRMWKGAMKCCLLYITWLFALINTYSCSYLDKTYTRSSQPKFQHRLRRYCPDPIPNWGAGRW